MNKLIARLREVYQLAADATEDAIIAKFNEAHTASTGAIAAKGKVIAVLGMKPEDTIEAIEAKAKAVIAFQADVVKALGLKPEATLEEVKAFIVTAKVGADSAQQLQARVVSLETAALTKEVEAIIAKGMQDGKILPAVKDEYTAWAKKDLAGFQAFLAKTPVVGPVGRLPIDGEGSKGAGITETDLVVAAKMGIKAEDLRKYSGAIN